MTCLAPSIRLIDARESPVTPAAIRSSRNRPPSCRRRTAGPTSSIALPWTFRRRQDAASLPVPPAAIEPVHPNERSTVQRTRWHVRGGTPTDRRATEVHRSVLLGEPGGNRCREQCQVLLGRRQVGEVRVPFG